MQMISNIEDLDYSTYLKTKSFFSILLNYINIKQGNFRGFSYERYLPRYLFST